MKYRHGAALLYAIRRYATFRYSKGRYSNAHRASLPTIIQHTTLHCSGGSQQGRLNSATALYSAG